MTVKRRRFIPIFLQHFEVTTLQTLWSLKSFILKKTLQCQIDQLTDVDSDSDLGKSTVNMALIR